MPTATRTEESIFADALDRPTPAARAAFLKEACGNDVELRNRVENLLKSHTGADSFLRKALAVTEMGRSLSEGPGTVIGPYKLLQEIGEGGMGVVYMADQEAPVRRRVALKIIKPGMDSREVIARFEAERQALAMMDHQNIARVLDAGTTESGRPYFVMELVHGVPFIKFCDENRLTLRQRLELFIPVCQAIQHAHQKGIIHRDIKPSNILVTMYDDKPVPKVIDFGVAKAVDQRLTEKTLFTQYGTLVGTFEYMSPEQAQMNAFGVDTRSDIYSLGVLLYELLTGTTPLERQRLRETALQELLRMIKEEEPPRPSARLSSSGALPKVAAACRTDPARLPQLVRGELDWIVMKCLEKDRTRRYETANGLSRDVQRYLADEPVEACPPSMAYRFRKFSRKHRGLLTTATSFLALLLIGVIVSTWLAAWAMRAQRTAHVARAEAEAALVSERTARAEAEAAKHRAEGFTQRLRTATQIANDGIESYYRNNWADAYQQFNQAQELEPDLWTIYANRSMLFTTLGLWDRAVEDYDRRYQLVGRSQSQGFYEHALLKIYLGDVAGYRQVCQNLLAQDGHSGGDQQQVILACVLSPDQMCNPADLVRRSENLLASQYNGFYLALAGRAHLRAGNYEQAVRRLREGLERGAGSPGGVHRLNRSLLANALQRLGRTSEAEQELAAVEKVIDGWTKDMVHGSAGTMPIAWSQWLECLLYYREAKTLIAGSSPDEDPRLIALYNRALAAITQGDAFSYMRLAREQIAQQAWDDAAASFVKVLDQLPRGFRSSSQEMRFCVEMVQQPEVFDRLVTLRPRDARLWYARHHLFATRREWVSACADAVKALQLREEEIEQAGVLREAGPQRGRASVMFELAAFRLLAGDDAGYRELCATTVSKFIGFDDLPAVSALSRTYTLGPGAVTDASLPVRLGDQAVAGEPNNPWYLYALGVAHYRAGQSAEAIRRLEASLQANPAWIGRGQNYAVLAMACQQLGRHDAARDWLAKAKTSLDEMNQTIGRTRFGFAASDYLSDWLALLILIPEAEALVTELARD